MYSSSPKVMRYQCNPALSTGGKFPLTSGTLSPGEHGDDQTCVQPQVSADQGTDWETEQRTPQREREDFHRKN